MQLQKKQRRQLPTVRTGDSSAGGVRLCHSDDAHFSEFLLGHVPFVQKEHDMRNRSSFIRAIRAGYMRAIAPSVRAVRHIPFRRVLAMTASWPRMGGQARVVSRTLIR
ncbi:MAG TPA: hypothetical protein VGN12_23115 [Pirellulales bacterium]|jgi:hypothetical protein